MNEVPAVLVTTQPTLRGRRCVLRPFEPRDLDAMGAVLADPDVVRLTGSARSTAGTLGRSPVLDDATRDWYLSRPHQSDRLDLAVVDVATGACVGEVVLNEWDPDDAVCNFRILLGADGRGRGLGTEATRLLLTYAFGSTTLHRIELEVLGYNPRARRAYEKAGFVHEGTRREAFVFDGERVDVHVMAALAGQWDASTCAAIAGG